MAASTPAQAVRAEVGADAGQEDAALRHPRGADQAGAQLGEGAGGAVDGAPAVEVGRRDEGDRAAEVRGVVGRRGAADDDPPERAERAEPPFVRGRARERGGAGEEAEGRAPIIHGRAPGQGRGACGRAPRR